MQIKWYGANEGSLWYMLKVLIEFVLKIAEHEVYHSDLKNPNIVVIMDWQGNIVIRVIDMGGSSFQYNIVEAYTPKYMPSLAYFKKLIPGYRFPSKEERLKAEFQTIGTTLYYLMISSLE